MLHVLSDMLPTSVLNAKACSHPPLKLLLINSIAELLHYNADSAKMSMAMHQLTVIMLNYVMDMWDYCPVDIQLGELLYMD